MTQTGRASIGASKPTGPAGGVLTGTYPNPGIVVNPQVIDEITAYCGPVGPSGICLAETMPRSVCVSGTGAFPNGSLYLHAVYLPKGVTVSNLGWCSGTTAAVAPTHQWLALFDNNLNMLANTADQGAAAINAATPYSYPIAAVASGPATTFTTTYAGVYYIGLNVVTTTTQPTIRCVNAGPAALDGLAPVLCGTSTAEAGGPPGYPFQGSALVANSVLPYLWAN